MPEKVATGEQKEKKKSALDVVEVVKQALKSSAVSLARE